MTRTKERNSLTALVATLFVTNRVAIRAGSEMRSVVVVIVPPEVVRSVPGKVGPRITHTLVRNRQGAVGRVSVSD